MKLSKGVKWNTRVKKAFVYGDEGSREMFQRLTIFFGFEESTVILLHTLIFCHDSDPDIQCTIMLLARIFVKHDPSDRAP